MARTYRRNEILTNPFYLALVAVSTIFVVTALAYLVSGFALDPANVPASERSRRVALWFDRNGPLVMTIEFLVMFATGVVMMATDRWYTERRKRGGRG
ncbi:hypothetical protein [Paludisphaera borealis]|uniref:Uncharacterized protein n=1 Tax=Paludisphaera borealis TaxID=1387353 RepID=A0A1U7CJB1_9BACT|nr:hypothetical protein [Paludisphaera borealis]APW59021.1 hypothetical protein BSF38_00434 [Paludisphaera borealis]